MLFGVGVSCRILYSIVSYLYDQLPRLGKRELICLLSFTCIMWFMFGEFSSSSWCLGWAALFYCGTPWAFHIIIVISKTGVNRNILAHYIS